MRNISFALTTEQFRKRSKTVTRRLGWLILLKVAMPYPLMGCLKCMGFKLGEKIERLGPIEVISVRRERLDAITPEDVVREGFPGKSVEWFIDMFCKSHNKCTPETIITRIEFRYL